MKKNSCTPINPKKYSYYGLKNIHARNLITKKNSCGSKIPLPPHNFSNGPSLSAIYSFLIAYVNTIQFVYSVTKFNILFKINITYCNRTSMRKLKQPTWTHTSPQSRAKFSGFCAISHSEMPDNQACFGFRYNPSAVNL